MAYRFPSEAPDTEPMPTRYTAVQDARVITLHRGVYVAPADDTAASAEGCSADTGKRGPLPGSTDWMWRVAVGACILSVLFLLSGLVAVAVHS